MGGGGSVHNMPWATLQYLTRELHTEFPAKILLAEITPDTPDAIHG